MKEETETTKETGAEHGPTEVIKESPAAPDAAARSEAPAAPTTKFTLQQGRDLVQNIIAEPPAPVPGLAETLKSENGAADSTTETPESGKPQVRVNPEDYKHLKDWRKRPFDPSLHIVNPDGSPKIGEKNRLQCLKPGMVNPVEVILSKLPGFQEEFAEPETQDEKHAQVIAQVDHGRIDRKAGRLVNFWMWLGTLFFGLGFRKNKRERVPVLKEAMSDYMVETGKEIDIPPVLNAFGAFVADFEEMLWLNVGENPKDGAVKKFLLRRLPFARWGFSKLFKRIITRQQQGTPPDKPETGEETNEQGAAE